MACCKDKIKSITEKAEKLLSVAEGNLYLATDNILKNVFKLPTERYELAENRKIICRKCEKCTWLSATEYLNWLKGNGIEVFKNLEDLTVLPELPKQEYKPKAKLFCSLCKCWIPAKAEVQKEKCPLDKWDKES